MMKSIQINVKKLLYHAKRFHSISSITNQPISDRSTAKRDALIAMESIARQKWSQSKSFEVNAQDVISSKAPKYLVTFPFPYMNGRLHLGHAFSLSKAEFAAGYQRMRGKKVLFPFGFHGTGMPIKACADKLRNRHRGQSESDIKAGEAQWQILRDMGIPEAKIPLFADPNYWLEYFPPRARQDLEQLGLKVDWRRSFVTTEINPHFSSFVEWQFQRLKKLGLIRFGKRHTIFSPRDNQPCMDHDRQSGEGIQPQQWTLFKMPLIDGNNFDKNNLCLLAATLRPETMYGQTNCFVGPDLVYSVYQSRNTGERYVCLPRVFDNLKFQTADFDWELIGNVRGKELIGKQLKAPLSQLESIRILPMKSISADKGSGIVTSVPSDSPVDLITLLDLKSKPKYYDIKESWISDIQPVTVIESPSYGNNTAAALCQKLKINSPNDVSKLEQAKSVANKDGYYNGKMIIGDFKGQPVATARELVRNQLISKNDALDYWEPESKVISRSGDECVVAVSDQWYLAYGDFEWKQKVHKCLARMETYHRETKESLSLCIDWLNDWACARKFGLGTKLPWDNSWKVESLSDSTIYMAFYTVSHILEANSIDSSEMNEGEWDFIMGIAPSPPESSKVNRSILQQMREEMETFYPVDLRVSGRDLVNNHLTFSLFNHVAIFPESKWPREFRTNGHLLLNGDKMSKSTGNFMTIKDALSKFGSDATRFALAEAGDGTDDANFDETVADSAILKLYNLNEWMENHSSKDFKDSDLMDMEWIDRVFQNEMNDNMMKAQLSFDRMEYFLAVKWAFHSMLRSRDFYALYCNQIGRPRLNSSVVADYIRNQILALTPIVPHFAEYAWDRYVGTGGCAIDAKWPENLQTNPVLTNQKQLLEKVLKDSRLQLQQFMRNNKIGSIMPSMVIETVQYGLPKWQRDIVEVLNKEHSHNIGLANKKPQDFNNCILDAAKRGNYHDSIFQPNGCLHKQYQAFVNHNFAQIRKTGKSVILDEANDYDHAAFLNSQIPFIKRSIGISQLEVVTSPNAIPGRPQFRFVSTQ